MPPRLRACLLVLLGSILLIGPRSAFAATNAATGGVGGVNNGTLLGGDGTGPAVVTFNVTDLALVKQARDLQGNVLANGATVAAGQDIYFVLYVDNSTPYPAQDLQLTDLLTEVQFTYFPNSLAFTTVASGSSDAAMWAASWTPLSDDTGAPDDIGSIVDTGGASGRDRLTLGSVSGQANQTVNIPAMSRIAIRLRARVN
jgi:uncharacterized repeat protein (TIGR01451 family)